MNYRINCFSLESLKKFESVKVFSQWQAFTDLSTIAKSR